MNKLEQEAERKEAESQRAFEALKQHEATHTDMERQFAGADKDCIACAQRLMPLDVAGSPTAAPLRVELHSLRGARDGISWSWNRQRELLAARLGKINLPEILSFHGWIMRAAQRLQTLTHVEYERSMPRMDGSRLIGVRTNAGSVAKTKNELFRGLKSVQALRLKPLLQIHTRINEVVVAFESALLDLPMERLEVSESRMRELQSISGNLEKEPETITYRGGIRYVT